MKFKRYLLPLWPVWLLLWLAGCGDKAERVKPVWSAISESVYAAGTVKSGQQYQAFATGSGVIQAVFVREGDSVRVGAPLLSIATDVPRLTQENAALAARYADVAANRSQLQEARERIALQRRTMQNDLVQLARQRRLWEQSIGTKLTLEQRELAYAASKTAYESAVLSYQTLQRQLDFAAAQARKNLQIARTQAADFIVRSKVNGLVYQLYREKGEAVTPQTALALLGDARHFVLEMQVDESDIVRVRPGQQVLVTLDSYKGQVFTARVTRISPMMSTSSRTFEVDAAFVRQPPVLYPFVSFEANIVLQTNPRALLIPRRLLVDDSTVRKSDGKLARIKTGLRDYQMVEILSGLTPADELTDPAK
ncbi:efflux RND transporter periplasmic adaptor subunit [Microvirga sp. STR05]|uniref:Efflux RND transporter periplasmic adaptor subunit n=1 Tax=Hymenobacter duratus TaxID=2771356 RepID=A0ABR8JKC3_9BACT|nr:efflux RND transporter periplasmic adaptor subunit [Hymenobacter duratus]MBD2717293.1 efflux RND transporter periplasmic adaptor subunit [Hymenobacter duratus]MBR7952213.1 efflux RND transporter periplasmic adaptor subunit [Microvirga sp. STR05]